MSEYTNVDPNVAQEANYVHGKLDGTFTEYHNGVKYQVGHYAAGTMTGEWTTFYSDGKRDCVASRDNDSTVAMTCYNEAGKLTVRGKSPGGIDDGLWEWFQSDGTSLAAAFYKNGAHPAFRWLIG